MRQLFDVSATTNEIESHFDMLFCFLGSAKRLRANAYDGIAANRQGRIGQVTDEVWNGDLITAFYLLRHSLELAVKALIKETKDIETTGHDIKALWEEYIPSNYKNILFNKVNNAFCVLDKYDVLKNEQLFRYHASVGKNNTTLACLKNLPNISSENFGTLSSAVDIIRHAILCCIHLKKGLPSEKDELCHLIYLSNKPVA